MSIQILLLLIIVAGLFLTWKRVIDGGLRRLEGVGWTLVWLAAGTAVSRPEITTLVARFFGVGRGADLAMYASVLILFSLVFHLHVLHDRIERALTDLVRHQALRDLPKK